MGNEEVDLCDRKWNERFRQKVMEEYERQQNIRERQLAEAEVRRVQKLRLQGALADDDEEAEARRHNKRNNASHRRGKKKSEKYLEDRTSKHQSLYSRPDDNVETQMQGFKDDDNEEKGLDNGKQNEEGFEEQKTQDSQDSGQSDDHKDDAGQNERLPTGENDQKILAQTSVSSESGNSDMETRMNYSYKSQLGRAHMGHESHEELQRFYDMEDLRELYAEAEKLVWVNNKKK